MPLCAATRIQLVAIQATMVPKRRAGAGLGTPVGSFEFKSQRTIIGSAKIGQYHGLLP